MEQVDEYSSSNYMERKKLFVICKNTKQERSVLEHVCGFNLIDESSLPSDTKIKLKYIVDVMCCNFNQTCTSTHRLQDDTATFFEQNSIAFNNNFVLPIDILQYAASTSGRRRSGAGRPGKRFGKITPPSKRIKVADLKHRHSFLSTNILGITFRHQFTKFLCTALWSCRN